MYALKRRFFGPGEQSPGNHLRFGLLGLPNSGKSTLFNALMDPVRPVSAENFLFTTLETTIGSGGECPDSRIDWLGGLFKAEVVTRVPFSLIDGPGIVHGSFAGAGEGLDFLPKYRDVEVFINVLRGYDSDEISHYENSTVDPVRDAKAVVNELMRYDFEEIDARLRRMETQLEQMKKDFTPIGRHMLVEVRTLTKCWECLLGQDRMQLTEEQKSEMRRKGKSLEIRVEAPAVLAGVPLRYATWTPIELEALKKFNFFSTKEMVYVLNVSARDFLRGHSKWSSVLREALDKDMGGGQMMPMSCAFEWSMRVHARNGTLRQYFDANPHHEVANKERGVPSLLYACTRALDLVTFYTLNDDTKVFKAWFCRQGTNIKDAAYLIDYQLYKTFQRGQTFAYDDIVEYNGDFELLNEFGKHRHQVKSYIITDGDTVTFMAYRK